MAARSSRLAPPAVAGGTSLLVVALAAVVFGGPVTVDGSPLAGPVVPRSVEFALGGIGTVVPVEVAATVPAQAAPAPVQPAQPVQPKPAAKVPAPAVGPTGQRPGTVRLAKGGTATLVRKELGPDATLPVPAGVREATWWGAGLDASVGATVFAGHVDWKGQVGPFSELWSAHDGDEMSVVDSDGRTWRYRISRVETVAKTDIPNRAEELFGQSGHYRLVLVTCGGRWVGGSSGYESNRVVTATRL
jgi:hypothetical protein